MPAPGLFTVQAGIPGQADVPGQAGVPGQAAGSGQPNLVYLPDRGAADVARYSPDGSRLAFAVTEGGRLRLWVAALEDGRAVSPADLTPAGFDFNGGYAWSPDGSRLVLAGLVSTGGKQRYGLAVIPVAGQDPSGWLAFAQQWRLAAPSWSQGGGGRIFFLRETSQGTVLAGFDVAGGTPADILQVCGYDLSADGRWLAYLAETGPRERTLYVVELERLLQEGSRGTAVASGDISSPVISSDGGLVAYAAMGATPDESGPHVWLASAGGQWKSRLSTGAGARPVCFRPGAGGLLVELLPATTAGETPVTLAALFYLP
jgi:Tol biopolymer transport system component